MSHDFIDDLLKSLNRVIDPDVTLMKEVLIVGSMPEATENLRYLGFNRQIVQKDNRTLEFSAVALINNRRAAHWVHQGYQKKISQIVFSTRWTRNPLDLFLNNIRCDEKIMDILASSTANYTLLGILQVKEIEKSGCLKKKLHYIQPVVAIPDLSERDLKTIIAFESANEITKTKIKGIPLYRKMGSQMQNR